MSHHVVGGADVQVLAIKLVVAGACVEKDTGPPLIEVQVGTSGEKG
jgi:hypothetical protein